MRNNGNSIKRIRDNISIKIKNTREKDKKNGKNG